MSSTRMRPFEARMAALRGAKSGCGCGHAHGPAHAHAHAADPAPAHEPRISLSPQNDGQASAPFAQSAAPSVAKQEAE